jgi:hypothetical protein
LVSFISELIFGVNLRRTLESCEALKEGQSNIPSGTISLLGNEKIDRMRLHRLPCVGDILLFFGGFVEEPDDIGVLLDGSRFTKIR